jgi:hypothetical protein
MVEPKNLPDDVPILRRLVSDAALLPPGAERRTEERASRVRPVILAPDFEGRPVPTEAQFGLSTDITTKGLSAYVGGIIPTKTAYVGFRFEDRVLLFLAELKSVCTVGGGFFRYGLEFVRLADREIPGMSALQGLAAELGESR